MKKLLFISGFVIVFVFVSKVTAQNTPYDLLNPSMKEIATLESEPNWIKFKAFAKINPKTLFENHKTAFELLFKLLTK